MIRADVVRRAWDARPAGASVAEVAQSLGMTKAGLEKALQRQRLAGWDGYQTPVPAPVEIPERRCGTCDRVLLTETVWRRTPPTERHSKACYGAPGLCKAHYEIQRQGGPRRVTDWLEDWQHLRRMDVSPEEASRRLGVAVSTLLAAA